MICEIFAEKVKQDQKCQEMEQPFRTMEAFMYDYLKQKYGLKQLIIEWASAIIFAVKKF